MPTENSCLSAALARIEYLCEHWQHLRQEFSVGIENSVRPSVKTVRQYITLSHSADYFRRGEYESPICTIRE